MDSFGGVALLDFFVVLSVYVLFFLFKDFGFLFFEIFETENQSLKSLLLGLLQNEVFYGEIRLVLHFNSL